MHQLRPHITIRLLKNILFVDTTLSNIRVAIAKPQRYKTRTDGSGVGGLRPKAPGLSVSHHPRS